MFFNTPDEEYFKRKEYFNFFYSDKYNQKIINDFDFFKNYMAETFRDSQYVHVLTDYKLKRKESIVLEFNIPKSKYTHLMVRDSYKDWILYEYSLKNGKVRVPRDKKIFLILYTEGTTPLIQTMMISSEKDTIINLELEEYTKGRLLDEINNYRQ
jgi:DNA primase large subunit